MVHARLSADVAKVSQVLYQPRVTVVTVVTSADVAKVLYQPGG